MKHYPNTVQNDPEEIERFIRDMKMATLITCPDSSFNNIETGVFNPVYLENKFYLHLNRTDEQFKALKQNPHAHLVYFDFLCNIPSYWIDPIDGGVATSYYRNIDFTCKCKIYEDKETLVKILPKFLKYFQKEGGYTPITTDETIYQSDYKVLGIVELEPISFKSKFKLGQNRDIQKRLEIVSKLKERGESGDLRAASEIEHWISKYQN